MANLAAFRRYGKGQVTLWDLGSVVASPSALRVGHIRSYRPHTSPVSVLTGLC